ncbi:MAG: SOS response-associated peptidase [Solirubrobacteraceae bacterium]
MCGRYTLTSNDRQRLGERFGAPMPADGDEGFARFNVAPTEAIAVVVVGKAGERESHLVRWGLVPGYAKEIKGPPMFNARSETVGTRAPFKGLLAKPRGRCLILADGFYEWLRPEDKKAPRVPFRFTVDGGEPFAFAGLWGWSKPEGEWLASATMLTTTPNAVVGRLHDRMPVVLPGPDAEAAWLSPSLAPDDALALCLPLDADRMQAAPANPRVNRSGLEDEGADLLVAP